MNLFRENHACACVSQVSIIVQRPLSESSITSVLALTSQLSGGAPRADRKQGSCVRNARTLNCADQVTVLKKKKEGGDSDFACPGEAEHLKLAPSRGT